MKDVYNLNEILTNEFQTPIFYRLFGLIFNGDYNEQMDEFLHLFGYLEFFNQEQFVGNQLLIELIDAGYDINPFTCKVYCFLDSYVTVIVNVD